MSQNDKPDLNPEAEAPTLAIKFRTDVMTNTVVKDKERGLNLLVIGLPLSVPKYTALGFLWTVIQEMTTFYEACEIAAKQNAKGGLVKGTMADAVALGKKLLKS